MSVATSRSSGPSERAGEEGIHLRRYADAVRRHLPLILAIVVVMTGAVVAVSLSLPPTYQANAKIVFEDSTSVLGQTDSDSTQRRLATTRQLLTVPRVLNAAGRKLAVDGQSLRGKVTSSVDAHANIINVRGEDRTPKRAAAIANAVSDAFLAERAELDRLRISAARRVVQDQIEELSTRPNSTLQIRALRERLSDLGIAESATGTDLQIAERARPPGSATSPRPLRNGVLALFGSLFLGVLVALGRDQFAPRVSGTRELSRILGVPVLLGVPYVRRGLRASKRRVLSGIEEEAYQTLRATLQFSAASEDDRVQLITGAVHGEGKTTVAARLARALARAGQRVLVVSGDLRVPKLHEEFRLPLGVGLADILALLDWGAETKIDPELLEKATNVVIAPSKGQRSSGYLHVITSGSKANDPGRLIAGTAMRTFLSEVRQMDYDFILIDAPPLLGLADSQALAQWTDAMIIVSRLDRITVEHASELREVLDRLETRAIGLVAIGVHGETSPYYLTRLPPVVAEESRTRD